MHRLHGIGVDLTSIARVHGTYKRFGHKFLQRAFAPTEAAAAAQASATSLPAFLASRWAAKEALHKALRQHRLLFPEVEVTKCPTTGAPGFSFHGAAADVMRQYGAVHLSLSHEGDTAAAFVVVEQAAAPRHAMH